MVSVEIDPKGDEVATSFSLSFDPSKLKLDSTSGASNPDITLGAGAANGTGMMINADEAASGRIGIVLFNSGLAPFAKNGVAGGIVTLHFHVANDAAEGETAIAFDSSESAATPLSTADAAANSLTANYIDAVVTIGPNAARVTISGRVVSPDGRMLKNVKVTLLDSNGKPRTVTTNSFGNYSFDDVESGGTCTIGVASKSYRFASRIIQVTGNLTDIDFTAQE